MIGMLARICLDLRMQRGGASLGSHVLHVPLTCVVLLIASHVWLPTSFIAESRIQMKEVRGHNMAYVTINDPTRRVKNAASALRALSDGKMTRERLRWQAGNSCKPYRGRHIHLPFVKKVSSVC